MLIRPNRIWNLPETALTPEGLVMSRRAILRAGAAGIAGAFAAPSVAAAAERNPRYVLDRPITDERLTTTHNNFYEFGSHKRIASAAQGLRTDRWTLKIDGLVEKPFDIGFEDLVKRMPVEERHYRHRCVEAWSMAVPWTGFALAELVKLAKPQTGARYLRFESFHDPDIASGQRQSWYPWPYIEGLALDEAMNDLAFVATGVYGKPLPKQMGAPLRLALPWKYGFKSAKSLVRISFTAERPVSFWTAVAGEEYGFWANVNPDVPHRRWSQAREEVLGTGEKRPTLLYNGYGPFVASLYDGRAGEKLFM